MKMRYCVQTTCAAKKCFFSTSLAVFIVSDSEDVDDGIISDSEDNSSLKENQPPPTVAHAHTPPGLVHTPPGLVHTHTPACSTPYTPCTGVVFWGASEGAASNNSVTPAPGMCSPDRQNHTYATPG